ncbi:MAG: ABC transporter ATP-binding protein [Alkalinema sp. RU_4_3]|nr:ABC transporter ATP-binding protein [Alkalinema sp. RU_4_3]
MATVRLDQISRRFGKTTAIADITLDIPDGEFWVLVGPSGCGKSTILRMIAGLEEISSGDLYIGDRRVNDIPARQRDVAMVFQNYALYPHMSVAENLAFGLKMRGMEGGQIQGRVQAVAEMLDIAHLLDRKPRQLSGGQQQRVALGRAIARSPQVFLLDEPLSNLDAQLRDETRAELKQLHSRVGITTLYVTHDQVEAMTLADQIVVLDQGRIQQIGDPRTIYTQPANRMVATFVGSPPMNILPVVYTGSGFQLGSQVLPEDIGAKLQPNQRVELGIRPEHIQVGPEGDLAVQVTLVEPLGREILLRAVVADTLDVFLNLQVPIAQEVKVGDRLGLRFDPEQICLFDPGCGDRLYP